MPILESDGVTNHVHSLKSLAEKITPEDQENLPIVGITSQDGKVFHVTEAEIVEIDGKKEIHLWLDED